MSSQTIAFFEIEVLVIEPLSNILDKLRNGDFRDCDVAWLNNKLETYVSLAAKTFNIDAIMPSSVNHNHFCMLNKFAIDYYTLHFEALLKYFNKLTYE